MTKSNTQLKEALLAEPQLRLVVLDIYSPWASAFRQLLSTGATVSAPDVAYEGALELFEGTRLDGDVIWISAEGLTLDELIQLEAQWLAHVGKAVVLMGANQQSIMNQSLKGLMTARSSNAAFQATVITAKDNSVTETSCRFIAQQSGGWMQHHAPAKISAQEFEQALAPLGLSLTAAKVKKTSAPVSQELPAPAQPSAQVIDLSNARGPSAKPAATAIATATDAPAAAPAQETDPAVPTSAAQTASSDPSTPHSSEGNQPMATLQDSMNACLQIEGAFAAALVDIGSGMALAKVGGGMNLDVAAAGNTEVIKAKLKTMASLGVKGTIEDILITLDAQYHLIRLIPHKQGLFLYLALDKARANLAMARFKLMEIEKGITV
jgi:hypothetical protein